MPALDLNTTQLQYGDVVLTVAGEVDVHTAPALREALLNVFQAGPPRQLVVDLSGVPFMDSTGLGVLVGACTRLRASNGDMRLVVTRQVHKVLQLTGLTAIWDIDMADQPQPTTSAPGPAGEAGTQT